MTELVAKYYETAFFAAGVALFALLTSLGLVIPQFIWVILLLTVGAYHGGYDACLLDFMYPNIRERVTAYLAYACAAAVLFLIWWISPILFVAALVAETLYHFGGEDTLNNGWKAIPEALARGLIPFAFSAYFYPQQVVFLFTPLLQSASNAQFLTIALGSLTSITIAAALCGATVAKEKILTAIELFTLGFNFFYFPPLQAFTLYFILLHTLRHMRDIYRVTHQPYFSIWLEPKAWLSTICAVTPLPFLYVLQPMWSEAWLSYPFLAFGCLTLPHMYLQKRIKNNLIFTP